MTKMWLSLIAILIMGLSVFLITFARSKTKGLIRAVLSVVAFLTMIIGFLGGVASIM
ncbi:putative membrane protein YqjE [Paenibacillus wynnii]|nr:putative membrane protein YqjE [Paenibacillus wynnii]